MGVEDDYYDESDELYDEEEENGDFHVLGRLQAPSALQYTTRELHTLIHEGVIDLSPPYQRDVVWPDTKQSKLIDSVFRNYYVPPLIFAEVIEDGAVVLRCVDGKQRLTSIQRFFDGQIPYRDLINGKSFWYTVSDSVRNKLEVPQYWKDDFASKQITCIKFDKLKDGYERDIFQRVQLGIPLTPAERLQAIDSPWASWISELDRRMLTSDSGLSTKIEIDLKRGRNFQMLAHIVYCCAEMPKRSTPVSTKLEAFITGTAPPRQAFRKDIDDVMTTFWAIADNDEYNMAFRKITQRVAPAEFVFTGVLLYVLRDCDMKQRALAVYDLRKSVRTAFTDVRLNEKVQRFLWDFIQDQADRLELDVYLDAPTSGPSKKSHHKKRTARQDEEADTYSPKKPRAKRAKGTRS